MTQVVNEGSYILGKASWSRNMPPPKYYIKRSLFIWSFLIKQSKLAALPIESRKKEEIDVREGWGKSEKIRVPPSHHSVSNQGNTTLNSCEIHIYFCKKTKINLDHMCMKWILQIDFWLNLSEHSIRSLQASVGKSRLAWENALSAVSAIEQIKRQSKLI